MNPFNSKMLAEKKQQIHTQIGIVDKMKILVAVCPNTVMDYFSKEKHMSLIQAERLEKAGVFSFSGILAKNLKEQNEFYHPIGNIILHDSHEENCVKCDRLHKLLNEIKSNKL